MKAIYTIINKVNGKQYIGSAVNFYKRKTVHLAHLRKGNHKNIHLQRAYTKYGEASFMFCILEKVYKKEDLISREQWWIDTRKPEYNIAKIAGSQLGFRHSQETKDLLSNNQYKGLFDIHNPFSKKCYQYSLDGTFLKEWNSISQIERDLGLNNSLIVRCLKGRTKTAHKFQWFYEFMGEQIEPRIIKQRKNGNKSHATR